MLPMEELEDKKFPYIINLLIILLVFVYLVLVVITSNKFDSISISESLKHDFSNIIYQNGDTTTLYLYYTDDGLDTTVLLYLLLFMLTILLLVVSFVIRKSLITLLLLIDYILNFSIVVYPYIYFTYTKGDTMFLTSAHFLLLTSYLNHYSLYIFIPYYTVLIGLTLYFIVSQTPLNRIWISQKKVL